jgi:hypothetical protein
MEQEMGNPVRERVEAITAFIVPPACREEVLGDLHERNSTLARFCIDALRTVPHVVLSRIRRTADPQLLVLHAIALYLCYFGSVWFEDRALLRETSGLLRVAVPVVIVLLAIVFDDAYAKPGRRSPLYLARGPLLGFVCTFLVQSIPLKLLFYGGAMGLPVTVALRIFFSPQSTSRQGPV